jgi:dihydrofolate reductase
MRQLKLQIQITIDGFVARTNGELDWMKLDDWDDELKNCENDLIDSADTILMGRKMSDGFVKYWTSVLENPESPEYEFAKKMVDTPKVVFTKTLDESPWANTVLAKGDLVEEVTRLKNQTGKDLLVYGGADFVSSLIEENLIDEYNLFINPTAIGRGMTIFGKLKDKSLSLKLNRSQSYNCGIVLNTYLK